jgi:hypothetical protein
MEAHRMALKANDWVEVRSKEEILATLDANARLGGLPFMPQMLQYSGQRFKVYKRAHKTCDPIRHLKLCSLPAEVVHLDLRCDGKAYGGCDAACLIYWRDEWLKPVDGAAGSQTEQLRSNAGCTEADVLRATRRPEATENEPAYVCQATEVPNFTVPLPWWDLRQYLEDYTSGNVTLWRQFCVLTYAYVGRPFGRRFASFRWLYDKLQALWGGVPYPRNKGVIPLGEKMPIAELNLQPGELVRIKSYEAILETCDTWNRNRGMYFDAEMVPFCGRTYRVRSRVSTFLDENTGRMKKLKTPAVILENVWCGSRYSDCRMHCPRSIYSWWREVWLERVTEPGKGNALPVSVSADEKHAG